MDRIPLKYFAPNAVTCAGLTLGMVSVFHTMSGDYASAAWFILMCVLFDKADGSVARFFNASSDFGVQLDSFSDFLTFGIAPAFLVHGLLMDPGTANGAFGADPALMWGLRVSVVFYVLASCLRLAKFNVLTEKIGAGMFLGFPTTLCGALLGSYILTSLKYGWPAETLTSLPVAMAFLSFMMVSNVRLPKAKAPGNKMAKIGMSLIVASVYLCGLTWTAPEYLLGVVATFILGGVIYGKMRLPSRSSLFEDPNDAADTNSPSPT